MTRQELAEAVNAQVYRLTEKLTEIDANHIGKWERGDFRWPAAHYRQALRHVLNVDSDLELGFKRRGDGCTTENVDRRTYLGTTLGLGVGVALARSRRAEAAGEHVDELVASIAAPTESYRRMEASVSSQYLAPAAEGHLRLVKQVVRDKLHDARGFAALSEIAGFSAWLAADRGDTAAARARYQESIRFAESARNPLLVSYMIGSLGHFAVEIGDPHQGALLLDKAARQLDNRSPAAARAWLASLRAVAFGALRDRRAMTESLATAERLADRRPGEAQWPWVFTFTSAKVARYQSSALVKFGDLAAARNVYATAIPAMTAPKQQSLAKIEYALLLAGTGHQDEAAKLGVEALRVGKQYGSERIVSNVRTLRAKLPQHSREVEDLDHMLITLYDEDQR
ncbi:hypothetical protein [Saccharopolyspora sp. SCSIO 74807]|uniref:hypothetical protein n=1 Tax=Saccharopolyspora sp. SCSIO 74807 TaxID=3118084 RepID=UPI0030CAFBF5